MGREQLGPVFRISHEEEKGIHTFRSHDYEENKTGYLIGNLEEDRAVIGDIRIQPEYERQGFGKTLVESFIEWAQNQGAKEIVLKFLPESEGAKGAKKFWQNLGFEFDYSQKFRDEVGILVIPVRRKI